MAGKRSSPPPTSLTPGPIERTLGRLYFPRMTQYQMLCIRLGQLTLDLPVHSMCSWYQGPATRVRHGPHFPSDDILENWIADVMNQNVLAGMVLTDALEYVSGLVSMFHEDHARRSFPSPQTKKRLTQEMGEFLIDFEVPAGWELEVLDTTRPQGFKGVALVKRCHLSQNIYEGGHGKGQAAGESLRDAEKSIGFDIPCELFPNVVFEGNDLKWPVGARGCDVQIPYSFVRRAICEYWKYFDSHMTPQMAETVGHFRKAQTSNGPISGDTKFHSMSNEQIQFVARPSDTEILDMAKNAVERIVEQASQRHST